MQLKRTVTMAVLAALAGLGALAAGLGGCTSDAPNQVGAGLVDDSLDDALIEVPVNVVTDYGAVRVDDAAVPVHRQQVLYLGSQNGTSSHILANYDFADIYTDAHPAELFTEANIKSVKLSLTKLSHYAGQRLTISDAGDTTRAERVLYYEVRELDAAFDSTAYAGYPGAVPAFGATVLNSDRLESKPDTEPLLRLDEADFLAWLGAGQPVGLIVSLGAGSDEGLVGCAARELQRYAELEDVAVGTVVAPNLVIEFEDGTVNFLLPPVADTSTFHVVSPAPAAAADGLLLRTCLRSYPAFDFDFDTAALPKDVLINRAVLRLTNDRSLAFGNSEAIVVAEIDSLELAGDAALSPGELDEATYVITGQTSLDPTSRRRHLAFDVTTLVQRLVNDVYTDPRAIVLAAGEDIFPTYDLTTVDPDFYFTEFRFFGTAAADSLRPRLQITYSRRDERLGGAR